MLHNNSAKNAYYQNFDDVYEAMERNRFSQKELDEYKSLCLEFDTLAKELGDFDEPIDLYPMAERNDVLKEMIKLAKRQLARK